MGGPTTSVVDDLWVALSIDGAEVLNSLVRVQRKQFSASSEAAELGVPSTGMVAFLLASGREGLTPVAMADRVQNNSEVKRRLASTERVFADQVAGVRRLYPDDIRAIAETAGLHEDKINELVTRMKDEHPVGQDYCQTSLSPDQVIEAIRARRRHEGELGTSVVLTSIGAVLRFQREGQDLAVAKAELHGVVIHRKKATNGIVMVLSDGLDSINLIAGRDTDCFAVTSELTEQDRIRITGALGLNSKGLLSVFVDTCERLLDGDMIPEKRQLLNDLKRRGLPPRVLLGTVVQQVDTLLWERRFARFEPSIVSSALTPGQTVEPLDLYFPGLGARTNLVPSPVPQLIRAGIGLGIPKLYATSRIITRAIRDGFTSPDSPATFIFLLNADLDEALSNVEDLLWALLERLLDASGRGVLASEPPWDRLGTRAVTSARTFHRIHPQVRSPRGFDMTPFATRIDDHFEIVEGHVAHISTNLQYAVFSVQTERLLQLFAVGEGNRHVRFQGPESILIPGVNL